MSNFPTSLPSFTNPSATDYLNSPAHHTNHSTANDETFAVATKVGIDSSAVTSTHDYKLSTVITTAKAVSTAGNQTIAGNKTLSGDTTLSGTNVLSGATTLSGANTVSGPSTFTKTIQTIVTESDGATVTFDLDDGNIQQVTLTDNRTLAISNEDAGQVFIIKLIQDGGGTNTVTWFSTIKWPGGVTPTLTSTGSKADVFGFITTGADTYDGFIVGQNL